MDIDPALPDDRLTGPGNGGRRAITAAVTSGVCRLFRAHGIMPLTEFRLADGRRVDVAGLDRGGALCFVEVKSAPADLMADRKWPCYLGYCTRFYFAVDGAFPRPLLEAREMMPERCGIIIADRFDGAIIRPAAIVPPHATRRRATILRFARQAAGRLDVDGV